MYEVFSLLFKLFLDCFKCSPLQINLSKVLLALKRINPQHRIIGVILILFI